MKDNKFLIQKQQAQQLRMKLQDYAPNKPGHLMGQLNRRHK